VEVILSAAYQRFKNLGWDTILELVLSICFLVDTTLMLIGWNVSTMEGLREELVWVSLDVAAYMYLVERSCRRLKAKATEDQQGLDEIDATQVEMNYKNIPPIT